MLKRYPIASYFILTYLVSWVFLIPAFRALLNAGWAQDGLSTIPPVVFVGLLGVFGPTIVALILSGYRGGRQGVKSLLKRYLIWRVNWGWYVFVLFVPLLLFFFAVWLGAVFSGTFIGVPILKNIVLVVIGAIAITIPFGPLPEELGWRGYALPHLLRKFGPVVSSLVLGFFWTFWHIPAFFVPGVAIPSAFALTAGTIFLYLLNNTALSFIFTGIFLRTRGSVLLAILLHAGSNASSNIIYSIFPASGASTSTMLLVYVINIVLMTVVGLGLLTWKKNAETVIRL